MAIAREGGDFGCSAEVGEHSISGRFAGSEGGRILVTPPFSFDPETVRVKVADKLVPVQHMDGTIIFAVAIALGDGAREYTVEFDRQP